ncbi:MAG: CHC2 zinc finger domain-containing protein, partial [Oscillospiraceae bacterium]
MPQSFIETLKMSCDIESIVSGYVALKRQGRNLSGLCPFHSEKTPSMVVYNDSQSFYCFGCGAGGDAISFLMRIENLDYIEAVKFLCQRVGLSFPENGHEDASSRMKPVVLEINRTTANFFHNTLKSSAGVPGQEYFAGRGLSTQTIVKYGLGYAPEGWDHLRKHLRQKGFTDEQMVTAAVASRGKNDSCYDMFRNRVIFPIIDL